MTGVVIRKVVDFVEDTLVEGGKPAARPLRMAACAAVIRSPWGSAYVEDLQPGIHAHAAILGDLLVPRLVALMGGPEGIEAFGKAAVCPRPLARPSTYSDHPSCSRNERRRPRQHYSPYHR